jgi:hypothetical protein
MLFHPVERWAAAGKECAGGEHHREEHCRNSPMRGAERREKLCDHKRAHKYKKLEKGGK